MTKRILERARDFPGIEVRQLNGNRVTGLPGEDQREAFIEAKRTLVVKRFNRKDLQGCRPSANFQLPLASGCPGHCHYCYLNTTLGLKPYVRVYPNLDRLWEVAESYMAPRRPKVTQFEGSGTSDVMALEPWTGSVRAAIEHFAKSKHGRFRVATKYTAVDSLLDARHQGKTRIRYSINTGPVTGEHEKGVPPVDKRIEALGKLAAASFPVGVLIGPIFLYEKWKADYAALLDRLRTAVPDNDYTFSFELITHRFTPPARTIINQVYPTNTLPMDEEQRQWKHGQFGYGKWVYPKEAVARAEDFFRREIHRRFPAAKVVYMV